MFNQAYYNALEKCNPQQLEAIKHIEGPVLVLAGPGTGKTQILSLRIGHILDATDMQPHNLLCLTYTDAGTVAMRKRLINHIGTDAYKIPIHTFHSFCNMVIQQNRDYFAEFGRLEPITELEQVEIMYNLINSFKADNPLKRYTNDVYYDRYRLKNLFDTIKKESFSPEYLIKCAHEYIESLPFQEEFIYKVNHKENKKGDPNAKKIKEETDKINQFIAAVQAFKEYNRLMLAAERYDFNDMIYRVIEAFEKYDTLLGMYQEQFQYILVDEFQDTNGSQNKILDLLTAYWDVPNVFVVGDDDQSIYSFQGAENARINDFVKKHGPNLFTIVLTENYRSTQTILDAAKTLVEQNSTRLIYDSYLQQLTKGTIHKNLNAFKKADGELLIREYDNEFHESAHIAFSLLERFEKGENLKSTAIIYRNHRQVQGLVNVLAHLKVPFQMRLRANALELSFVKKCINILTYLRLETEEPGKGQHLLFEILHYDFWDIQPADCTRLMVAAKGGDVRLVMADNAKMFKMGLISASAISFLEQNLTRWQKDVFNCTVQVLFEKIISYGGIVKKITESDEKINLLGALTAFFDFIKDESAKNPHISIGNLLDYIEKMQKNSITLPVNQIIFNENGVNLLTAHSSKGLEFEHVYILGCNSENWEKKKNQQNSFKFPPEIANTSTVKDTEEERRLFYVAMTRAEKHLFISYCKKSLDEKDKTPSLFVEEVLKTPLLHTTTVQVDEDKTSSYALYTLLEPPKPSIEETEKAYVDEVLKSYKLSVTHLNKYLQCPLTFYYENILRVPSARTPAMGFGNAMHKAMERLFKAMIAHPQKEFPDTQKFLYYFTEAMESFSSHFTEIEFDAQSTYGKQTLVEYYQHYASLWNKNALIEYDPKAVVTQEGIPLSGKLDKVEIHHNTALVVDYKTGKPDNSSAKEKLSPPKQEATEEDDFQKIYGGNYWRQIVFYKILLENDRTFPYEMVSGEINYLEKSKKDNTFIKHRITPTPEDVKLVKQQIEHTYTAIMNHQFYTGCGKPDCKWCNFVNQNKVGISLSSIDDE